ITAAAKICQLLVGYETIIDEKSGTFQADFPMSQTAIYCGWYEENASGPFKEKDVEFMPGAFAYHLHSFSAAILRSPTERWVGPLLANGATATMGCVDEPYLTGTPDVGVFCARWVLFGFTFGEAAYASQPALSWQTTVIGDPLYRPFGKSLQNLAREQERSQSKSIEWSYLRAVNISLAQGKHADDVSNFLRALDATKSSAVLTEKLADLYGVEGKPSSTIEAYEDALKLGPSLLQRVRIRLELADRLVAADRTKEAYADLKALLDEDPTYPGKEIVRKKMLGLANKVGDEEATAARGKSP